MASRRNILSCIGVAAALIATAFIVHSCGIYSGREFSVLKSNCMAVLIYL
jgi:hypothetical protein